MRGHLGWIPTDCTAELRPTIYVHFYASTQTGTPRTHWFYFVNTNTFSFSFFARTKWLTRVLY